VTGRGRRLKRAKQQQDRYTRLEKVANETISA
jgi:hypothetical protein